MTLCIQYAYAILHPLLRNVQFKQPCHYRSFKGYAYRMIFVHTDICILFLWVYLPDIKPCSLWQFRIFLRKGTKCTGSIFPTSAYSR